MTEIEKIKTFWKRSAGEIITYTEGSLMDIIQLARNKINSLITTIESLSSQIDTCKEEIKLLYSEKYEITSTIESQKEEIENQLEQFIEILDEAQCRGDHILSVSSYLKPQIEKYRQQLSILQKGEK